VTLPALETLARIAADHDPSVGDWSPRHFYGGWAEVVDRYALLTAMAHAAFLIPDGATRSPVEWWRAGRPARPTDLRDAVRALERATLALWPVDAVIVLGRIALRDRAPQRGDRILARVVDGVAWGPIAIDERPS